MDQHQAFLIGQAAHIESEVYEIQYPNIQYSELVPVDTSAPEFAASIEYFSMDGTGKAAFLANRGNDFPMVDATYAQYQVRVENAGLGYEYDIFELGNARRAGRNLTSDRAKVARRISEEFIDDIVLYGQPDMGWDGLLNSTIIPKQDSPQNAGSTSTYWKDKTGDVNNLLAGVWIGSRSVEIADTLGLPMEALEFLADTPRSVHSDMSLLEWIRQHNIYTARTRRPLRIQEIRGLETQAAGNKGRAIAYRRDPEILKLHLPMPFRFLEPQRVLQKYCVPGIFRIAGLEIRRPMACRYLDLITAPRP